MVLKMMPCIRSRKERFHVDAVRLPAFAERLESPPAAEPPAAAASNRIRQHLRRWWPAAGLSRGQSDRRRAGDPARRRARSRRIERDPRVPRRGHTIPAGRRVRPREGAAVALVRGQLCRALDRNAAALDHDRQGCAPDGSADRVAARGLVEGAAHSRSRARVAAVHRGRHVHDRGHLAVRVYEPRERGEAAARRFRECRRVDRARRGRARFSRHDVSVLDRPAFVGRTAPIRLVRRAPPRPARA